MNYRYTTRGVILLAMWSNSTCSAFTHPPSSLTHTNTFMRRQPAATITSVSPASHGVSRRGRAREPSQNSTPLMSSARGDRENLNRAIQRTSSGMQRSEPDSTTPTLASTSMDLEEDFNKESRPHLPSYTTMEVEEFASPGQQKRVFSVNLDAPTLAVGRILVLFASLIYGTNFAVVKMLDDTLPLSISATLRFGLASAVVAALVLSKESDNVEPIVIKERKLAMASGLEIGMWYCIGYICQAEGLQTVTSGKVSKTHIMQSHQHC